MGCGYVVEGRARRVVDHLEAQTTGGPGESGPGHHRRPELVEQQPRGLRPCPAELGLQLEGADPGLRVATRKAAGASGPARPGIDLGYGLSSCGTRGRSAEVHLPRPPPRKRVPPHTIGACPPTSASASRRARPGPLHIGTARTALFNYLFARHAGGTFILRLEDTDVARSTTAFEKDILDGLHWLGITWDEGPGVAGLEEAGPYAPYRQMQRLDTYAEAAARLLAADLAYPCYCTPEELEADRRASEAAKLPPRYVGRCATLTAGRARRARGRGPPRRDPLPRPARRRRLERPRPRPGGDRHRQPRRRLRHRPRRRHAALPLHRGRGRRRDGRSAT